MNLKTLKFEVIVDVKQGDKCLEGKWGQCKGQTVTSTVLLLNKQKIPSGYTTPKILGTSNCAVVGDSISDTTAALICSCCCCTYTNIEHIISAIHSVRKRAAHQCHLALQHCHPTVGFKGFSEVLCHIILQWIEIHST